MSVDCQEEITGGDFWQVPSSNSPLDEATVKAVEKELGYRLPVSYVTLLLSRGNGGTPKSTCASGEGRAANLLFQCDEFFGIVSKQASSGTDLLAAARDAWEEWEYPKNVVRFASTPAGGPSMWGFDYSECGPTGEPTVVFCDEERDYRKTPLATSCEELLKKLVPESSVDGESIVF
jgi:hypothetical protein